MWLTKRQNLASVYMILAYSQLQSDDFSLSIMLKWLCLFAAMTDFSVDRF